MTINKETLDELKSALLKEKEELEKNLGRIAKPIDKKEGDYETSFETLGTDKDDNATEVDQYSQNLSVETSLEKQLQEIIGALSRMEKGTYGKCENCGKDIPLERLKANPSARVCLDC
ncbi:MAG TPA: TraR/DksA C4-type zinc finger protein [Candidatus Moranbacteria bacterium]|nr:TraR/DksA C4-type zinc finger protein [Candidatus Moranbacteria bacterium]